MKALKKKEDGVSESWLHYFFPVWKEGERGGKKEKVVDVVKNCLKNASYMNEQKEYKISSKKNASREKNMYISHLIWTSTK